MPCDIVLATLNARYSHASFGLRCLRANLGPWRERSVLVEGTLTEKPLDFVERVLRHQPRVVGLGVYVWNARLSLDVVRLLKQVASEVTVVLGGPEVSHEIEEQELCRLADYVVTGEGEVAFRQLCDELLDAPPEAHAAGRGRLLVLPANGEQKSRVRAGGAPELSALSLPYEEYTDEDVGRRTVYVEASRGCPFRCAFCLSALDREVRAFPLDELLDALGALHERGLRRFKFVDRTFNLAIDDALAILRFFRARGTEDLFLHFEMIPDRLPEPLFEELAEFPAGAIQLEVGLQTFDPEVARTIQRRTRYDVAVANIERLRSETGVHLHADLIAGLPGETWESFREGFDRLVAAGPQEIQLGILKRLRGAPLTTLPEAGALVFDEAAPYEVLRTPTLSFAELIDLRRAARLWDAVFNQGKLPASAARLLSRWREEGSAFDGLVAFTREVFAAEGALHGMALLRLAEHVHRGLLTAGLAPDEAAALVEGDYCAGGRRRPPPFLQVDGARRPSPEAPRPPAGPPPRQRRHLLPGSSP